MEKNADITLAEYLSKRRMTQTEFAALVGINSANISKLCNKRFMPSLNLAARIEVATEGEVKVSSWITQDQGDAA